MIRRWWPLALLPLLGCSDQGGARPRPAAVASGSEPARPDAPTAADALVIRANQAAGEGREAEALELLEQARASNPSHRPALELTAILHMNRGYKLARGNRKAAIPEFRTAFQALRTMEQAHRDLGPEARALATDGAVLEAGNRALEGDADAAMELLREVKTRLERPEELDGPDFAALRERDDFRALREEAEASARQRAASRAHARLAANQPFPFDFELNDLDGRKVSLESLRGKVTIVDFWGTWCPPCREEIPHFLALLEKYRDRGLRVVGINYEHGPPEQAASLVKSFAARHNITYPCLLGDDGTQAQVPDFNGFPTTLFLDERGTVRLKLVGYHPLRELEAVVVALLGAEG